MINFLKKQFTRQKKSYFPSSTVASFAYNSATGSIIEMFVGSHGDAIKRNTTIQTILNRQLHVISSAPLVLMQKKDGVDSVVGISESKDGENAFYIKKMLDEPNSYPSPASWHDICQDIYLKVGYYGLQGLVFTFITNGDSLDIKNAFEMLDYNVALPTSISLDNLQSNSIVKYTVQMDKYNTTPLYFTQNPNYERLFTCERIINANGVLKTEIKFLCVFGNYDDGSYKSIFNRIIDPILVQNCIMQYQKSFYQNGLFPSMLINLSLKPEFVDRLNGEHDADIFKDAIRDFKRGIDAKRGANSSGEIIMPSLPYFDVTITPLTIDKGADEYEKMRQNLEEQIFSFCDGISRNAVVGQSEYANNAILKVKDFYDGSFRNANKIIIEPLNNFLTKLCSLDSNIQNPESYYFLLNYKAVEIYKELATTNIKNDMKANLISMQHGYDMLVNIEPEFYGSLLEKPSQEFDTSLVFLVDITKTTVATNTTQSSTASAQLDTIANRTGGGR